VARRIFTSPAFQAGEARMTGIVELGANKFSTIAQACDRHRFYCAFLV
jgi:hypothetical protein